jgi:lipopolysaccharide/colanic/teichoic acid biosynthesis glycosyltransferase
MIFRLAAALLLIAVAPVLAICALGILLEDGLPVLFRQARIGRGGRPFLLLKMRSMKAGGTGTKLTAHGDSRITTCGRFIRHYKLDELPQLWNVLRGDMRFIGPRPEVPEYVDIFDSRWAEVLSVEPGITDLASLAFRNEEALLGQQEHVENFYRDTLLPRKLDMSVYYIHHRSFTTDLRLISLTVWHSLRPKQHDSRQIAEQFTYTYRG